MKVFHLILLCLVISGCTNDKFDKIDDSIIHELSKKSIGNYTIGDTITFKSNRNHSHSIVITRIDTTFYKTPGFTILANREDKKEINLHIRELDSTDKYTDPTTEREFISVIGYNTAKPAYEVWINYKLFTRELPLSKSVDTITKVSVYHKPQPDEITKLYWTKDKGLTGYDTAAGEEYRLH